MFIYVVLNVSGDQKVDGSGLISACCCVFSLERKLYSLLSLFNRVYKWVLGKNTGCSPAVNYHPSQGGLVILLVALCYVSRSYAVAVIGSLMYKFNRKTFFLLDQF